MSTEHEHLNIESQPGEPDAFLMKLNKKAFDFYLKNEVRYFSFISTLTFAEAITSYWDGVPARALVDLCLCATFANMLRQRVQDRINRNLKS